MDISRMQKTRIRLGRHRAERKRQEKPGIRAKIPGRRHVNVISRASTFSYYNSTVNMPCGVCETSAILHVAWLPPATVMFLFCFFVRPIYMIPSFDCPLHPFAASLSISLSLSPFLSLSLRYFASFFFAWGKHARPCGRCRANGRVVQREKITRITRPCGLPWLHYKHFHLKSSMQATSSSNPPNRISLLY